MSAKKSYMICTTPRSGSNWLCDLLDNTELAGRPREYFFDGNFPEFFAALGISSFDQYIPELLTKTQMNGVFGAKIMLPHFFWLGDTARKMFKAYRGSLISTSELMADLFPNLKYVWLIRRNKLRQAISYLKALQTNHWYARSDIEELSKSEQEPIYDFESLNLLVRLLSLQEARWQDYFNDAGIRPIVLYYEDCILDSNEILRVIFEFLEITIPNGREIRAVHRSKRISDDLSERWYQRYCRESDQEEAEWWKNVKNTSTTQR